MYFSYIYINGSGSEFGSEIKVKAGSDKNNFGSTTLPDRHTCAVPRALI
jgi:hypothetical protein